MNKKLRGFILVTLAISLGAWLTAQSPSFPGIQGFYPTGKVWKGVQVDKDGKLIVTASVTPSGTQDVNLIQVAGKSVATAGNGIAKVGLTDGTGNALSSTGGALNVGGAAAQGAGAGNPVTTGFRDDSGNVLAAYGFPDQNAFSVTGTDVVAVTGVSATKSYLKQIAVTLDSAQTVTIRQGTGTTCGTNTATIYGPFPATLGFVLDFESTGPLHTTVNARDICIHLGGSATAGGGVVYGTH
jgi:hypothetical protein